MIKLGCKRQGEGRDLLKKTGHCRPGAYKRRKVERNGLALPVWWIHLQRVRLARISSIPFADLV